MGDIHYMISEAAKGIGVESHVLRYWEEELDLNIGRTEMGHRYYTEEDMQLFHCIRRLKDEGVFLKELKLLVPEIQRAKQFKKKDASVDKIDISKEEKPNKKKLTDQCKIVEQKKQTEPCKIIEQKKHTDQSKEFAELLIENNSVLEQEICDMVTKSLKKEMTYLLDAKDQLEEERYRRLDTLIRQQQQQRKEEARKRVPFFMRHAMGT